MNTEYFLYLNLKIIFLSKILIIEKLSLMNSGIDYEKSTAPSSKLSSDNLKIVIVGNECEHYAKELIFNYITLTRIWIIGFNSN